MRQKKLNNFFLENCRLQFPRPRRSGDPASLDCKLRNKKGMRETKSKKNFFLSLQIIQLQKNRREKQPLALNKKISER